MRLSMYLEKHDKGTAIEFADAIINCHIPDSDEYATEEDYIRAREKLAEIAEHIQVYLKYNRCVVKA